MKRLMVSDAPVRMNQGSGLRFSASPSPQPVDRRGGLTQLFAER